MCEGLLKHHEHVGCLSAFICTHLQIQNCYEGLSNFLVSHISLLFLSGQLIVFHSRFSPNNAGVLFVIIYKSLCLYHYCPFDKLPVQEIVKSCANHTWTHTDKSPTDPWLFLLSFEESLSIHSSIMKPDFWTELGSEAKVHTMGGSCRAFWLRQASDRASWVCFLFPWIEGEELGCSLMEGVQIALFFFTLHTLLWAEIASHWSRRGPLLPVTACCLAHLSILYISLVWKVAWWQAVNMFSLLAPGLLKNILVDTLAMVCGYKRSWAVPSHESQKEGSVWGMIPVLLEPILRHWREWPPYQKSSYGRKLWQLNV